MESKKLVTYLKKNLVVTKMIKIAFKLYHKVRDHCHCTGKFKGAAHSISNLRYKTPKEIPVVFHNGFISWYCNLRYKTVREIPVVFHNGSIYDYHFIINQLAK